MALMISSKYHKIICKQERRKAPGKSKKKRDEIKRYLRQTLPLQILWHTLNYLNSI